MWVCLTIKIWVIKYWIKWSEVKWSEDNCCYNLASCYFYIMQGPQNHKIAQSNKIKEPETYKILMTP